MQMNSFEKKRDLPKFLLWWLLEFGEEDVPFDRYSTYREYSNAYFATASLLKNGWFVGNGSNGIDVDNPSMWHMKISHQSLDFIEEWKDEGK